MTSDFTELFQLAQMDALSKRESLIFELRYGFAGGEAQTLEHVGNHIGVSRERIRQILKKCHRKILGRGRYDIRRRQPDNPCGALLQYLKQTIQPQDDDAIERLVDFIENETPYLPAVTHALPLITYLVFSDNKLLKQHVREAVKVLNRRKNERWHALKQQRHWDKFKELLPFVIWPGLSKPLSTPELLSLKRQRNVSDCGEGNAGNFYSHKLERLVQYELEMEYAFFLRLETIEQIKYYQEQPFKIPYEYDGKTWFYYPDVLIVLEDGTGIVVEIKPVFKMALQINLKKWTALKHFCVRNRLGILITDGRYTLQQIQRSEIRPQFAHDVLSAINGKALSWKEYKSIRDKHDVKRNEFLALVLRHKLIWELNPFSLSR